MTAELIVNDTVLHDLERLRQLSSRVMRDHDMERQRVARELNDQIGQSLTAIKLRLQTLDATMASDARQEAQAAIQIITLALEKVNSLSHSLRPPQLDILGLGPTLAWYVSEVDGARGLTARLNDESQGLRLHRDIETACFYIAQLAFDNVMLHAQARLLATRLYQVGQQFHLVIEDDGKGFDMEIAKHGDSLGLLCMEVRAALAGGSITMNSVPGVGTVIHAIFPLNIVKGRVRQKQRATT